MDAFLPDRRAFLGSAAGLYFLGDERRSETRASSRAASQGARPDIAMLVFDTFGTVVDWRGTIVAEGVARSRRIGRPVDWAAFADAWRAEYRPSMERVRRGELPWTNLDELHRVSLQKLLPTFGMDGIDAAEIAELHRVWHRCRPWPDSVEGLTRLRRRHLIAPLSNGNISLLTNMAKRGELPWDCILGAEIVRKYKPDPEVYLSPAKLFALDVSSVMMVAAHTTDLEVPKKLGLRTAYVHRPYEGGTSTGSTLPAAGTYDYIVNDLRELAAVLGA